MPDPDLDEKLAWLRLTRSPGIGPILFFRLLRRFGNARDAVAAVPSLAAAGKLPGVSLADEAAVARELAATERLGARIVRHGEPEYPSLLAQVDAAPPVVTIVGDAGLAAGQPAVAIVGARNASHNGRELAHRFGRELAAEGFVVVSGLARGIDTAAHEGALDAGGATVAVIACGIDVAYPEENRGLMDRIAGCGLVVTERPLGAPPQAKHFPRRNRLISGMCSGVVVVEAAPQSGSLITARLAAEQGREVMAVPGSPLDPRHRGTNQLLREGATLVESAADIAEALRPLLYRPPAAGTASRTLPPARRSPSERDSGRAEPATSAELPAVAPGAAALTDRLGSVLGPEPVAVDELVRRCHASAASIQEALTELELEGRLERHPGNRVSLRAA